MKSVAIINPVHKEKHENFMQSGIVLLEKTPLNIGLLDTEPVSLEVQDPFYNDKVLVRKQAFSCNYRDKAILINLSSGLFQKAQKEPQSLPFSFFGSEFVGIVEAVGKNVNGLSQGDKVIPNCMYQGVEPGLSIGIPSNVCSQYLEVFPESKLLKIPDSMNTKLAAGFSIGAQTATAMVRKTNVAKGMDVLVTSATSNTSLFAISILKMQGANVYAIGSGKDSSIKQKILNLGVNEIFDINRGNQKEKTDQVIQLSKNIAFDVILDPFADSWMFLMASLLKRNGSYATCGYYNQHKLFQDRTNLELDYEVIKKFYTSLITKNLTIYGNCLGTTDDLKRAIEYHNEMNIYIDSHYSQSESKEFIQKTYNDPNRLGKVILKYDDQ